MTENDYRRHIDTETLVIAYAMSRLDVTYLQKRGLRTWASAYAEVSQKTGVRQSSIRLLRDEFHPIHQNGRKGWHDRPLRPSRARIVGDLCESSDDALMELVTRLLLGDHNSVAEAMEALSGERSVASNVAERLLTGRRAEEYFWEHSHTIVGIPPEDLIDMRMSAGGFDFGVRCKPDLAIEVKGIRERKGEILFTDREWQEAKIRSACYWAVVVGNLAHDPIALTLKDPYASLSPRCSYQTTISAVWKATVSVNL